MCVCVCVCRRAPSERKDPWVEKSNQAPEMEKEMATHSSILACKIPWTEKPGGLQSVVLPRVSHILARQPGTTERYEKTAVFSLQSKEENRIGSFQNLGPSAPHSNPRDTPLGSEEQTVDKPRKLSAWKPQSVVMEIPCLRTKRPNSNRIGSSFLFKKFLLHYSCFTMLH